MSEERDNSEAALRWDMREQILFPSRDREKRLPIRTADWERLKRCARQGASSPRRWLLMIASALYGVSATASLSIPLARMASVPAWVSPLYVCVAVFSLLTAVVFTIVDCKNRADEKRWAELLEQDMSDIESPFPVHRAESEAVQLRAEGQDGEEGTVG